MNDNTHNLVWDAENYHLLSIAQNAAADEFIPKLPIRVDDQILDIGCGNGRTSSILSKRAVMGSVLAVDRSEEMIHFASNFYNINTYSNLQFQVADALKLSYHNQFDVVFSSYVLQWIKDKKQFLQICFRALKENGILALIMPTSISVELEESINYVINKASWNGLYKQFHPNWYFIKPHDLNQLLQASSFQVDSFECVTQDVMYESKKIFESYIRLWFPYLSPIPIELQQVFFREVMECYYALIGANTDGSVLMKIPRVDLVARKVFSID